MVERVSEEMHIAALVSGLRQNLAQHRSQPGVIVGDDKFDPMQTARLEGQQKIPPARAALAIGELDREHPGLRRGRLLRGTWSSAFLRKCT